MIVYVYLFGCANPHQPCGDWASNRTQGSEGGNFGASSDNKNYLALLVQRTSYDIVVTFCILKSCQPQKGTSSWWWSAPPDAPASWIQIEQLKRHTSTLKRHWNDIMIPKQTKASPGKNSLFQPKKNTGESLMDDLVQRRPTQGVNSWLHSQTKWANQRHVSISFHIWMYMDVPRPFKACKSTLGSTWITSS